MELLILFLRGVLIKKKPASFAGFFFKVFYYSKFYRATNLINNYNEKEAKNYHKHVSVHLLQYTLPYDHLPDH